MFLLTQLHLTSVLEAWHEYDCQSTPKLFPCYAREMYCETISHAVLQKSHTHPVIYEDRYILHHSKGTILNKHTLQHTLSSHLG